MMSISRGRVSGTILCRMGMLGRQLLVTRLPNPQTLRCKLVGKWTALLATTSKCFYVYV